MISVDPGEVHVGWVTWVGDNVIAAYELTPDQCIEALEITRHPVWVVEEFMLYPWRSDQQAFHVMGTSELIGVIKYLARKTGVELVMQPASIKVPAFKIAKARKLKPPSGSQHVKDAWIHGYAHLETQRSKKSRFQ